VSTLNAEIPKGGSLLDRVGTKIYLWWFGFHDRTGAFRKSDLAEGVAASRFQSHRLYLHTILQEFCNIYRRIALLHRYKPHRYGIGLGIPCPQCQGKSRRRCMYPRVRMQGMRNLRAIHPAATLVDLILLNQCIAPHPSGEGHQRAMQISSVLENAQQHYGTSHCDNVREVSDTSICSPK